MEPTQKTEIPQAFEEPPVAALTEAELRSEKLGVLTDRIETLLEDPTVVWTPGDRDNPQVRTTRLSAPGRRDGERMAANLQVIDESGSPRWYVLDATVETFRPAAFGRPVMDSSKSVVYWSADGKAYAGQAKTVDGKQVRRQPSNNELDIAAHLTNPEISRVRRQVAHRSSSEVMAGLPTSGKVAHVLGRLIGKRNVTRF
jgi:hypothetical protein